MIVQKENTLIIAVRKLVETQIKLDTTLSKEDIIGITLQTCEDLGLLKIENRQREQEQVSNTPAVPIDESIHDDFIICLEDGKRFKMMKRHLRETYNMTPDQYRNKWGLPSDYPMTAPGYSNYRAKYAKNTGLGKYEREARLVA